MKCFLVLSVLLSFNALAESKIKLETDYLANIGSAAIEACGTVSHSEGKKPLLVNIVHEGSSYTTLSDKAGKWCVVYKRWNNRGTTSITASTFDYLDSSEAKILDN